MYDLEIIIPITTSIEKYRKRLETLRDFGLVNNNKYKVLLTFLTGTDNTDNIPTFNFETRYIKSEHNRESPKVYDFFSKGLISNSRWIAKIDDDSFTNIDLLIEHLDTDFDHKEKFYITAETDNIIQYPEDKILKEMGLSNWINGYKKIPHEIEACFVSNAAMKTIMSNPISVDFMKRRVEYNKGFTDIGLAIAARLSKIYAVDSWRCSCLPVIKHSWLCGGNLVHFHGAAHDKQPELFDIIKALNTKQPFDNPFSGTQYQISRVGGITMDFDPYGIIHSKIPLETYWYFNGGRLNLYELNGKSFISFNVDNFDNLSMNHYGNIITLKKINRKILI